MKSPVVKAIVFILCMVFLLKSSTQAQKINLEALTAYWKITDQLRKGDTLSKAAWKDFLQLDGNQQYIANQGFNAQFLENYRKTMQTVYMPQYAKTLNKMMEDKFKYWIAYKINQYQINEAALRKYALQLNDQAYLDSMYANAWKWLPKKLHTKSPSTHIFLIGIDNDALVQKDTIVFTAWSAYNQDQLKYGILGGHELHHVLRKPYDFGKIAPSDEGILYTLHCILNEGSADMIDKKYGQDHLDQLPMEYDFTELLLTKPDSIIKQIDTSLQVLASSKGTQFKTAKQFAKLMNYSSGHDPGYYMASIIVRNGYRKALIKNVQNPFAFVYLYNKAAKKDQQHPPLFSEAAIAEVKVLAKKYWKNQSE